jgi:arsenite methyltransferase
MTTNDTRDSRLATHDSLKESVRARYGAAALNVLEQGTAGCCGSGQDANPITDDLYAPDDTAGLPDEVILASLGCGNPTALASLSPGETVLDLGSGGGIDVLLSARRVGPTGKAYGLDMTDEMLALARANARKAGATNVEFLKGDIEQIPLPDSSVDVIISNCVVNLAADKRRVLAEAFRVLKPGGRFAVSDIVVLGAMPEALRRRAELWAGCVAGALEADEFRRLLGDAGFVGASVEPTRVYRAADARAILKDLDPGSEAMVDQVDGKLASAFIRARKPTAVECLTLRMATPEDHPRIEALLAAADLPRVGIPADLPHFVVAETAADGVIAAAGLELYGRSALLRSTVVDPGWRGSGVGRLLVDAALEEARRCGIEDIFLLTTTAVDYFPKFGFACVEREAVPVEVRASPEFQGACPGTAAVMHRRLELPSE